jgi:hypothetical protein
MLIGYGYGYPTNMLIGGLAAGVGCVQRKGYG